MAEPKRLGFTTIGPSDKAEEPKKLSKAVRILLEINDSTDTTYPDFSYPELMKNHEGVVNGNPEDPFGDDDDQDKLAAIAKSFEEKYAPKPSKNKKRKGGQYADLVDLGDGYDETDTFIDNSEAYDEVVPSSLTTKLGGFYINSGRLDFKEVSDGSEEDFADDSISPVKPKHKKRRVITDDDDDDGEVKKVVKKKKLKEGIVDEVKKKKRKKMMIIDGEKPFKKPKLPKDKEKLKQQNKTSAVAALLKQQSASTSPKLNGETGENGGMQSPPENLSNNATSLTETTSILSTIDSVIAMTTREDSDSKGDFEDAKNDDDPENIPKLPSGLSENMLNMIETLKKSAQESREGKCKFFTNAVNKVLLDVELGSRQVSCSQRSSVFGHLASYLPCNKDTLVKRAKALRLKEQDSKMKGPLEKLKAAVNLVMPALQEKFEVECQKAAQNRLDEQNKETAKKEGNEEAASTESDEEEKSNASEGKKKNIGPRKKFVWDSNIRQLLCTVVHTKLELFEVSKVRNQSAEEFVKSFLEREVKPIWPKGWMQTRMLYKESKAGHAAWTNPQKVKKMMLVSKTPVSTTNSQAAGQTNKPVIYLSPSTANTSKVTPGGVISKVAITTISPGIANSASLLASNSATPLVGKKITPTLLDYASTNTPPQSGSGTVNRNLPTVNESAKGADRQVVPVTKPSSTSAPQVPKNSWSHVVSDILRSTVTNTEPKKTSPQSVPAQPVVAKPTTHSQPSTQTPSLPKASQQQSFLAQFEKYAASVLTGNVQPSETTPQISPGQQQVLLQKKQKLLQEQKLLREKQQKLHMKSTPMAPGSTGVQQQMVKPGAGNQAKVSVGPGFVTQGRNSPAVPQTVHRSMADSSGRSAQEKMAGQSMSLLTENVIRKQLSAADSGSPSFMVKTQEGKQRVVTTPVSYGRVSSSSEQLRKSTPYAIPQSVSSQVKQPAQNQHMQPVVKLRHTGNLVQTQKAANQVLSGQVPRFQSPAVLSQSVSSSAMGAAPHPSPTSNSNGKSATSLLQSLFGQVRSTTSQPYVGQTEAGKLAMPSIQSPSSQGKSLSAPRWSPPPTHASNSHPGYLGAAVGRQSLTASQPASHQLPSYQGLKLSSQTTDTSRSMQHLQQGKGIPVPRSSAGNPGNQPSTHLSPGNYGNQADLQLLPGLLHPPHLTPQQLNSLNYGFPYPDSTQ